MTRLARPATRTGILRAGAVLALGGLVAPVSAGAQSLAERAARVEDGMLLLSFPARDGVCGDGRGHVRIDSDGWIRFAGGPVWEPDCAPGPVRVAAYVREGRIVDLDTFVGGRWVETGGALDLGSLEPALAARLLLDLAQSHRSDAGEDAIFPATLASGVETWPDLLALARDPGLPGETREEAVFWLGHAAGQRAVEGLAGLVDDAEEDLRIREAALYALSELESGAGIDALLHAASSHPDPRLRQRALFWLAETEDPRAVALFEEILSR